jgi:hypothetical protein
MNYCTVIPENKCYGSDFAGRVDKIDASSGSKAKDYGSLNRGRSCHPNAPPSTDMTSTMELTVRMHPVV